MSYKYNPYRDTFEHIPDEQPTTVNFPPVQYKIVKQIDLTQDSIEQIADAVVRKLKDVSVTNVGNIPIDAVPVKHGKWVVKGQDVFCSVCGEESAYTWHGSSKFSNYCPGCGAKMAEDGE